jgi:hypothetical protein
MLRLHVDVAVNLCVRNANQVCKEIVTNPNLKVTTFFDRKSVFFRLKTQKTAGIAPGGRGV